MRLIWTLDPICNRYCLFKVKEDGTKIKIIDPLYDKKLGG